MLEKLNFFPLIYPLYVSVCAVGLYSVVSVAGSFTLFNTTFVFIATAFLGASVRVEVVIVLCGFPGGEEMDDFSVVSVIPFSLEMGVCRWEVMG